MKRALVGVLVLIVALFLLHERESNAPRTAGGPSPTTAPSDGHRHKAGGGKPPGDGAPTGSGGAHPSGPPPRSPSYEPTHSPRQPSPSPTPSHGRRPSPSPSPSPTPPPGGSPSAWGVDAYSAPSPLIHKVQDLMGGGFEAFSDYEGWLGYKAWPGRTTQMAEANQALVYLNINTHVKVHGGKVPTCWRSISSGQQDGVAAAWAAAIVRAGYQRHMVITIEHEPNVMSRQQPKCRGETPADYRVMFDHVYRLMRSRGVTAPFAFVPTMSVYRTGQADAYLPPPSDVQVYGADVYNRVPRGRPGYHDAATDIATMLAWGDRHLPGRAVILGEIGDTRRDPAQGEWVSGVLLAARAHGHFIALNWNLTPGYIPVDGPGRDAWLTWARRWRK